jgi:hypothetical protein
MSTKITVNALLDASKALHCDCGRTHKLTAYGWASNEPEQRKPLTDDQIGMAFRKAFPVGGVVFTNGATEFARAIEAAHGIKDGDAA